MPASTPPQAPAMSQPGSIAMAVKLMYVGAGLSLLGMLSGVLMRDTIREAVEKSTRTSSTPLTPSQIDAAVGITVGVYIVVGLIGAGLWLWMAGANGKGKKWARIVATVFFGLSVLNALAGLARHPPALSLILGVITLALGGYIIYLLYRPESTEYYAVRSAPRY